MARRARFFDKGFVTKAIYGSISVLAVVLVMEAHPPNALSAVLTLFGTTLAIALAEAYSEIIGEIIAQRRRLDAHELKAIWHSARPILLSANLPTLILLLSAAGLFSVSVALEVAEWAIYVALFVYGVRVGALLQGSWWRILLSGLATLALGVLIGLIKVVFH